MFSQLPTMRLWCELLRVSCCGRIIIKQQTKLLTSAF